MLEIRAKARRLHQQHTLGLIIVDYLQLMRPDHTIESRVQQVGEMSRGLKILARELNVPVIALSQLSRAVESAHRQAADPLRPPRVRADRAGRRPRRLHLPRGVLRQGVRARGHRRHHHRQAPKRRARGRRADVREGVPEVPELRRRPVLRLSACPFDLCDGTGLPHRRGDEHGPRLPLPRRPGRPRQGAQPVAASSRAATASRRSTRRPSSDMTGPAPRVVRDFARRIDEHLDSGRGLWIFGGVGHRQDDAGDDRLAPGARGGPLASRSTRCRGCSPSCAARSTTTPSTPTPSCSTGSPASTSCTSTTSAPSRAARGSSSSSTRSSTPATRRSAR